jgi:phosphoribosylformimino-5-aminoimidazole carboxamide ribotide isomerase
MIVIPAIDLRGGRAVRLLRGNPDEETSYANDPVEVASRFQEEGARRLHLVDLDAALEQGENREVLREICQAVAIPVQIGGGVRTMPDIQAVLDLGAARAILGTPRRARPRLRGPGPSSSRSACSSRSTRGGT